MVDSEPYAHAHHNAVLSLLALPFFRKSTLSSIYDAMSVDDIFMQGFINSFHSNVSTHRKHMQPIFMLLILPVSQNPLHTSSTSK